MKKLGERNYLLIKQGVKSMGTFDPDEILFAFEEELYVNEYDEVVAFLAWVHKNNKTFGWGNYEEVFAQFKKTYKPKKKKKLPKLKDVKPIITNLNF